MLVIWKGARCEMLGTLMRRPSTNTAKICCQDNRFMSSSPVVFILTDIPSQSMYVLPRIIQDVEKYSRYFLELFSNLHINASALKTCFWCPWVQGTTVPLSVKWEKREVTAHINITNIMERVTKKH